MLLMKESVLSLKQYVGLEINKQHIIGFPTFKLPATTKNIL